MLQPISSAADAAPPSQAKDPVQALREGFTGVFQGLLGGASTGALPPGTAPAVPPRAGSTSKPVAPSDGTAGSTSSVPVPPSKTNGNTGTASGPRPSSRRDATGKTRSPSESATPASRSTTDPGDSDDDSPAPAPVKRAASEPVSTAGAAAAPSATVSSNDPSSDDDPDLGAVDASPAQATSLGAPSASPATSAAPGEVPGPAAPSSGAAAPAPATSGSAPSQGAVPQDVQNPPPASNEPPPTAARTPTGGTPQAADAGAGDPAPAPEAPADRSAAAVPPQLPALPPATDPASQVAPSAKPQPPSPVPPSPAAAEPGPAPERPVKDGSQDRTTPPATGSASTLPSLGAATQPAEHLTTAQANQSLERDLPGLKLQAVPTPETASAAPSKPALTELLGQPMAQVETPAILASATASASQAPEVKATAPSNGIEGIQALAAPGASSPVRVAPTEASGETSTLGAHPSLVGQVDGSIRWLVKNHSQEAEIQLHPASLGTVQIKLQVQGTEVHARIWVSNPEALPVLQEHRAVLEASLKNQGLSLGSFDLHQGHQGDQAAPQPTFTSENRVVSPVASLPVGQESPAPASPILGEAHRIEIVA